MSRRLCEGKKRRFDSCVYLRNAVGMSTACRYLRGKRKSAWICAIRTGLDADTPIYRYQEGKTGISSCKQTRIRFPCNFLHSPLCTLTLLPVLSSPSIPLDPTRLDADLGVLCPPAGSPIPQARVPLQSSVGAAQLAVHRTIRHTRPPTRDDAVRSAVHKLQVTVSFSLPS